MDETKDEPETPRAVDHHEQRTVVVPGVVPMAELRIFFDRAFEELGRCMASSGMDPSGPPFALYRGVPAATVDVEVGFPIRGEVTPSGGVVTGHLPAGRVVTVVHRGNYDDLGGSWQRLAEWAAGAGLALGDLMWEVYVTEPRPGSDPADMVTELFWTLRS